MVDNLIGKGDAQVFQLPRYGIRHRLAADATGTGKSMSLPMTGERCSRFGVAACTVGLLGGGR